MIIRYRCFREGRQGEAEVEFDASGQGVIRSADNGYIRRSLEEALQTTFRYESSAVINGMRASVPVVAEPGTPDHARGMVNPPILMQKGIQMVGIEDYLQS